jgi:hypothetical protein
MTDEVVASFAVECIVGRSDGGLVIEISLESLAEWLDLRGVALHR